MKLDKAPQGYFTSNVNDTEIVLYLTEDLLPSDNSLEKLEYMAETFDVDKRIIGLPDLHFKDKNFVPSGMTIPIRGYFSPLLLGPNNDGMGSMRLRVQGNELSEAQIERIFSELKRRIAMFRRKEDIIPRDTLDTIFRSGIRDVINDWGFEESDLSKFEDNGTVKEFGKEEDLSAFFPKDRPANLPEFVPGHDIYERGGKCIAVLDGTSHFIELFKVEKSIDASIQDDLGVGESDYFFLIHAGAGDVTIVSHRSYLNKNENKYRIEEPIGLSAYNSFALAGNFGNANRLYIYRILKEIIEDIIPAKHEMEIFSDVPHDYLEYHQDQDLFVHRKGASKLFPGKFYFEDHPWRKTGTPYLFPSCVGGDAYIIVNELGNADALNTVSHGAGRLIRKDRAIDLYRDQKLGDAMKHKIKLFRYGVDDIEGQNPLAFKDIDIIMQTFESFNLARPITKLKPLASLKA
jgi:tRNA-splicing ligase RtcB (3'-phosphate/5'-hydroxy nucleic acid ligase)